MAWPFHTADFCATTGELYKAKAPKEDDVSAVVNAYMTNPATTAFLFEGGY